MRLLLWAGSEPPRLLSSNALLRKAEVFSTSSGVKICFVGRCPSAGSSPRGGPESSRGSARLSSDLRQPFQAGWVPGQSACGWPGCCDFALPHRARQGLAVDSRRRRPVRDSRPARWNQGAHSALRGTVDAMCRCGPRIKAQIVIQLLGVLVTFSERGNYRGS